jgi:3',5'-cyclic AMP phosphodiesterase CpdA
MFTFAHLSDLHLPMPPLAGRRPLAGKRILGYLSYQLKRKNVHRQSVLTALVEDLHRLAPDHIAITGDLTNIALPGEFDAAARWLHGLGAPNRVTVVPGNHDALVAVPWPQSLGRWAAYMSDPAAPLHDEGGFPFVRRRGPVALIGVSSACPSPPFHASGRVGADQLARLARLLEQLGTRSTFRVVLIHHPPIGGMMTHRKRLIDQAAFRAVIARAGAELVLHGHHHLFSQDVLATPNGMAPVLGVPSASASRHPGRQHAGYHVCRLAADTASWGLEIEVRDLAETGDRFTTERRLAITIPNGSAHSPTPAALSAG